MERAGKKIIAQQTMTSQVTEELRRDILSRQIPVGSHIGVKEMAERYGVSNIPVREAFFTLAAEKLIEMSPYKGAVVLPIDRQFISDIYEMQNILEEFMNIEGMKKITADDICAMEEINQQIKALQDTPFGHQEYLRLNSMFHQIVYDKCSNAVVIERWNYYHHLIRMLWTNYRRVYNRMQQAQEEHRLLIEAFKEKNEERVRQIIHMHSTNARKTFMSQYMSNNAEEA